MRLRFVPVKILVLVTGLVAGAVIPFGPVLPVAADSVVAEAAVPAGFAPADPTQRGFGIAASPADLFVSPDRLDAIFNDYRSMGMLWLRTPVEWSRIQTIPGGAYDWSHYDLVTTSARAHGLRVIGMIGGTPAWARAADCTGTKGWEEACPPLADIDGYAAVNAAMAERYPDMVIEVWNEPNQKAFWSPAPDPAQYTAVLVATYRAVKAAAPATTVLSAGLTLGWNEPGRSMNPVDFLAAVYDHGGGGHFDGVAWHPYLWHEAGRPASMPGVVAPDSAWYQMYGTKPSARSVMTSHGDGQKKIWVTELGANTSVPNQISATEAEQAQIYGRAIALWRSYDWAAVLTFYTYQDFRPYGAIADNEAYFGLLRSDRSAKPAVGVVRSAIPSPGR